MLRGRQVKAVRTPRGALTPYSTQDSQEACGEVQPAERNMWVSECGKKQKRDYNAGTEKK